MGVLQVLVMCCFDEIDGEEETERDGQGRRRSNFTRDLAASAGQHRIKAAGAGQLSAPGRGPLDWLRGG